MPLNSDIARLPLVVARGQPHVAAPDRDRERVLGRVDPPGALRERQLGEHLAHQARAAASRANSPRKGSAVRGAALVAISATSGTSPSRSSAEHGRASGRSTSPARTRRAAGRRDARSPGSPRSSRRTGGPARSSARGGGGAPGSRTPRLASTQARSATTAALAISARSSEGTRRAFAQSRATTRTRSASIDVAGLGLQPPSSSSRAERINSPIRVVAEHLVADLGQRRRAARRATPPRRRASSSARPRRAGRGAAQVVDLA